MINFLTRGKKGDLIMLLYVIKAMGGGRLFIASGEFEESLDSVLESMGNLVLTQDYIESFQKYNGEHIDVDLDIWRMSPFMYRRPMLHILSNMFGLPEPKDIVGWISVPPDHTFKNKIVVHRRVAGVPERVNPLFDWRLIIDLYGSENIVFVSKLIEEWKAFGYPEVEYHCPNNIYDHACVIKGCRLFIGNQSSPAALADAVGVKRIFELSCGPDKDHFAVKYSKNAWYYACKFDSTIRDFRFVKYNGRMFDLCLNRYVGNVEIGNNSVSLGDIGYQIRYLSSKYKTIAKIVLRNKIRVWNHVIITKISIHI